MGVKKLMLLLTLVILPSIVTTASAGKFIVVSQSPSSVIQPTLSPCYGTYTYSFPTIITITKTYVYAPLIAAPPVTFTYVVFEHINKTVIYTCNGYQTTVSKIVTIPEVELFDLPWFTPL